MDDDYVISISRTPDGHPVITADPNVPLEHECVVGGLDQHKGLAFIHLDVIHNGKEFPVWVCDSQDQLGESDMEKRITQDRRKEIIKAIEQWEAKQYS